MHYSRSNFTIKKIEKENQKGNDWQTLFPFIDQELILLIDDFVEEMSLFPPHYIGWMNRHITCQKWFNNLLFGAIVCAKRELASQLTTICAVNSFLDFSVPKYFSDFTEVEPAKVLKKVFTDVSYARGARYLACYQQLQFLESNYLNQVPETVKKKLVRFTLPKLIVDKELSSFRTLADTNAKKKRKEETDGIVKGWEETKAKIPLRYEWMKLFERKYQDIIEQLGMHNIELPQKIVMPGFDGKNEPLNFLVWNQYSWVKNHPITCEKRLYKSSHYDDKYSKKAIIQYIGNIPENDWFLEAINLGVLQGSCTIPSIAKEYLKLHGFTEKVFQNSCILRPSISISKITSYAKKTCNNNEEDTNIIFSLEPLLISATLGTFSFLTFSKTAMRIGEFLQLSMDKDCMDGIYLQTYDECSKTFRDSTELRYLWNLFPKGKGAREPYEVDELINTLMADFLNLHKRYLGYEIKKILPNPRFSHETQFKTPRRFVLQWSGVHCNPNDINTSLFFMTLNHYCVDSHNKPITITSHRIRHCVATLENKKGVHLRKLMELLHHINPETTEYYSQLPFEVLLNELLPILEDMSDEIQIDPSSLRTMEDIDQLINKVLTKYGALRKIPGGKCGSFESCKRLFHCARCINFIPGLTEKDISEIKELIETLEKGVKIFESEGKKMEARKERKHIEEWKMVIVEIENWRHSLDLTKPDDLPYFNS